jgi:hypothetical protein
VRVVEIVVGRRQVVGGVPDAVGAGRTVVGRVGAQTIGVDVASRETPAASAAGVDDTSCGRV